MKVVDSDALNKKVIRYFLLDVRFICFAATFGVFVFEACNFLFLAGFEHELDYRSAGVNSSQHQPVFVTGVGSSGSELSEEPNSLEVLEDTL